MGWIVESLSNVFLEVANDLLKVCLMLYGTIQIDIGYSPDDDTKTGIFDSIFPDTDTFMALFVGLGIGAALFIMIYKLYQIMLGDFASTSDSPVSLVGRGVVSIVLVMMSYDIFIYVEKVMNKIYLLFKDTFLGISDEYEELDNFIKLFGSDVVKDVGILEDGALALTIILLVCGFALIINIFKLTLEIFERYVIVGALYYTTPLAFSTLTSKDTSQIFSRWTSMILSQFFLLILNLFFLTVFAGAMLQIHDTSFGEDYIFETLTDFFVTLFVLVAWLVIGQKVDEHLNNLGFSVAQSGGSLASTIIGAWSAVRTTSSLAKSGYNLGKKAVGVGKNIHTSHQDMKATNKNGDFERNPNNKLTEQGMQGALRDFNKNGPLGGTDAQDIASKIVPAEQMSELGANAWTAGNGLLTGYDQEGANGAMTFQAGAADMYQTSEGIAARPLSTFDGDYITAATPEMVANDANALAANLNSAEQINHPTNASERISWEAQDNGTVLGYKSMPNPNGGEPIRMVYGQAAPDYIATPQSGGISESLNIRSKMGTFDATVQRFDSSIKDGQYQGTIKRAVDRTDEMILEPKAKTKSYSDFFKK